MVTAKTVYGVTKGTSTILRKKTGNLEYYSDNKLIKEVSEGGKGKQVIRIMTTSTKSGKGIAESKKVEATTSNPKELLLNIELEKAQQSENIRLKDTGYESRVIYDPKTRIATSTPELISKPQETITPSANAYRTAQQTQLVRNLQREGSLPMSTIDLKSREQAISDERKRSFNYGYGKFNEPVKESLKKDLPYVIAPIPTMIYKKVKGEKIEGSERAKAMVKESGEYFSIIGKKAIHQDKNNYQIYNPNFEERNTGTTYLNMLSKYPKTVGTVTVIAAPLVVGGVAVTTADEVTEKKVLKDTNFLKNAEIASNYSKDLLKKVSSVNPLSKKGAETILKEKNVFSDINKEKYSQYIKSDIPERQMNILLYTIQEEKKRDLSIRGVQDWAGGNIITPLTSEETKKKAFEKVYYDSLQQGYSKKEAEELQNMFYQYYTSEWGSQLGGYVGAGAVSNKIAGKLLPIAEQATINVGKTGANAFMWSRGLALAGPGAFEGAVYNDITYRKQSRREATGGELLTGAGYGAISAPLLQMGIEGPLRGMTKSTPLAQKTGKILSGRGVETFAYVTDPIEAWGDLVDFASQKTTRAIINKPINVRTWVFNQIQNSAVIGVGPQFRPRTNIFASTADFVYTPTSTNVYASTKTDVNTKNQIMNIEQNDFNFNKQKSNVKSFTFDFTKEINKPKTDFNIPNTLINPNTKDIIKIDNKIPSIVNPNTKVFPFTKTSPLTKTNVKNQVMINPRVNVNVNPRTQTNPFTNVFVYKDLPLVFFPAGGFGKKSILDAGRKAKKKKKYTPSLTAVALGIKGKKNVLGEVSGIGIRPVELK